MNSSRQHSDEHLLAAYPELFGFNQADSRSMIEPNHTKGRSHSASMGKNAGRKAAPTSPRSDDGGGRDARSTSLPSGTRGSKQGQPRRSASDSDQLSKRAHTTARHEPSRHVPTAGVNSHSLATLRDKRASAEACDNDEDYLVREIYGPQPSTATKKVQQPSAVDKGLVAGDDSSGAQITLSQKLTREKTRRAGRASTRCSGPTSRPPSAASLSQSSSSSSSSPSSPKRGNVVEESRGAGVGAGITANTTSQVQNGDGDDEDNEYEACNAADYVGRLLQVDSKDQDMLDAIVESATDGNRVSVRYEDGAKEIMPVSEMVAYLKQDDTMPRSNPKAWISKAIKRFRQRRYAMEQARQAVDSRNIVTTKRERRPPRTTSYEASLVLSSQPRTSRNSDTQPTRGLRPKRRGQPHKASSDAEDQDRQVANKEAQARMTNDLLMPVDQYIDPSTKMAIKPRTFVVLRYGGVPGIFYVIAIYSAYGTYIGILKPYLIDASSPHELRPDGEELVSAVLTPEDYLGKLNVMTFEGFCAKAAAFKANKCIDPGFREPPFFRTIVFIRARDQPEDDDPSPSTILACIENALTGEE